MDAELPSTSAEPEQVAPAPAVSPPPFQLPIPAGSSSNALLTTVEQTPQVSNHASSSGSTPLATPEPVTAPKKDKLKLVLVSPLPDENISHCHSCDRTFTPLLLRFKNHCRICGHVFCSNCVKMTSVRAPDAPPEILTCLSCHEAELKRQEKEAKRQLKKDTARLEQEHLTELFAELNKAYESNDESRAIVLKGEIDRLKASVLKREQDKQAKKVQKAPSRHKSRDEKRPLKPKKTSDATGNGGTDNAKPKTTKTAKPAAASSGSKTTNRKPIDTPETIATKLERCYTLKPSKLLNPPSDSNRKCLVLDIDYTLFDHKWQPQVKPSLRSDLKQMIPNFKRPYLHDFLETCNTKYDIFIWSATGMPAIDSKCTNLGIYSSTRYKVTAVLCKDHMIHVTKPRKGGRTADETVKPLSVVWRLFPQFYNSRNTIHVDDMICNFQLNPGNGIHILPYKESSINPGDTELVYLTRYLMMIADTENDFAALPHKKWKEYLIDRLWGLQMQYSFPAPSPEETIDKTILVESEEAAAASEAAGSPPRPSTPAHVPEPAAIAVVSSVEHHSTSFPHHPHVTHQHPHVHAPLHHIHVTTAAPHRSAPTSPVSSPSNSSSPFAVRLAQPEPEHASSSPHGSVILTRDPNQGRITPEPHNVLSNSSTPQATSSGPIEDSSTPPLVDTSASHPQLQPEPSPWGPSHAETTADGDFPLRRSQSGNLSASTGSTGSSGSQIIKSPSQPLVRSVDSTKAASAAASPVSTPPNESRTWIRSAQPKLSPSNQS